MAAHDGRAGISIGLLAHNNFRSARVHDLGPELEARGWDSVCVPEHSHIPVVRRSSYPGGELPEEITDILDPFVSLAATAMRTDRLRLCTGISLALQHDLLSLAGSVATLDQISGGRVTVGMGAGWNAEELADHRPDLAFSERYSALDERIRALRRAWSDPESGFDGRWDSFSPSVILPRPVQDPLPLAVGSTGPVGMRLAASRADAWCPVDVALVGASHRPVVGAIEEFRAMVERAGRDPETLPIHLFIWQWPDLKRIDSYIEHGVTSFVIHISDPSVHSLDETRAYLDRVTAHLSGVVD